MRAESAVIRLVLSWHTFLIALVVRGYLPEIKAIWRRRWPGYSLVALCAAWLIWRWISGSPGYAITGMAVAAGVMALCPEMDGWERSLWFVLLVLLAAAEIKAINNDRQKQNKDFGTIVQGFANTINGLQESLNVETGINSLCYIVFEPDATDNVGVVAVKIGKYPVRGVTATITDAAKINTDITRLAARFGGAVPASVGVRVPQEDLLILPIPDFATQTRFVRRYQLTPKSNQDFTLAFSSLTSEWVEKFQMRRVQGRWALAMLVETSDGKPIFCRVNDNYPRVDGKLDVPWTQPADCEGDH
jgi:hypothetical protein